MQTIMQQCIQNTSLTIRSQLYHDTLRIL